MRETEPEIKIERERLREWGREMETDRQTVRERKRERERERERERVRERGSQAVGWPRLCSKWIRRVGKSSTGSGKAEKKFEPVSCLTGKNSLAKHLSVSTHGEWPCMREQTAHSTPQPFFTQN